MTFLNRYLGKMIEILTDNQASSTRSWGTASWPFSGRRRPWRPSRPAVACALQMQAAMDEINALNAADDLPHLEMGIAVNTARSWWATSAPSAAPSTAWSVAHVNFTSRIEAFAVVGQVLISPGTYERLRDLLQLRGEVQARMKE